ncbi:nucleotide-binding protein [Agrobacterium sp. V1]|uniref:nucleotide-binding protein n=1 Tax=Agrobacterium sp. V1 TaxID=3061957 RepID=UPI002671F163|nr:nucleotide-binding protein [Agrobacterium sp. V1]MDO3444227.1 nucleotide-binding protein [Agrobacterium sp. V1]
MTRASTPPPRPAKLSAEQMRSAITRIKKKIIELEAFDPNSVNETSSPEVQSLETGIDAMLSSVFGHGTIEYNRYRIAKDIDYMTFIYTGTPTPAHQIRSAIAKHKATSLATLKQAIKDLEEELEHISLPSQQGGPTPASQPSSKVFLVHGRDNETKNEVARFLERIGIEVIILHERPNLGRHLLTKFQEEAGDVGFAVVLITPDDEGGLAGGTASEPRARQNVIFELGFFIGRLGPRTLLPSLKRTWSNRPILTG